MRRTLCVLQAAVSGLSRRPALQDVAMMDAAALGRAARGSIREGDHREELWHEYAARASDLVGELSVPETARLASAFSLVRLRSFDLFARLSTRVLSCVQAQEPVATEDLRRLAIAFGSARSFDTELMEALVPLIVERVEEFRPRQLVHIANAYSRMPVQSPELFALVAEALPPYLYDLEPAELAGVGRAFAEAAVYNKELTDGLCTEVLGRLRSFGCLECLVFLEGLARLKEGLPKDMQRDDSEVVIAVAGQLAQTLGTLSASDLVRVFRAIVHLDHYDPRFVHNRLCSTLAQKLGQLSDWNSFGYLAELLHCLSLLPSQSHKSAELALATCAAMRQVGVPKHRKEPRSLALAAAAVAQLDLEEEELLLILSAAVRGVDKSQDASAAGPVALLGLAGDEELKDLQRAFRLCSGEAAALALAAIEEELSRRDAASTSTASAGVGDNIAGKLDVSGMAA